MFRVSLPTGYYWAETGKAVTWDFIFSISWNVSQQQKDLKPLPLPKDFETRIKNRLNSKRGKNKKSCNDFLKDILKKAAENQSKKTSKNGFTATDGLDLLEKISKQGGFELVEHLRLNGYGAGATVWGSIEDNNATVVISTRYYSNKLGKLLFENDYVTTAIHEMAHLGGKFGFGDTELAQAAYDLGETKTSPMALPVSKSIAEYEKNKNATMVAVLYNSSIWDGVLVIPNSHKLCVIYR